MTTTKPKAIFFDLDETLIENKAQVTDLFGRLYLDFQEQLGADQRNQFFTTLRLQARTLWNDMFDHPDAPEEQFIRCFESCIDATESVNSDAQRALAEAMFDHFVHLSSNNVTLHHDALSTLAELKNRGVITGIITNGIEQVQLGKIHRLGLDQWVDHITVSAQARAHKPSQAVFELALDRAQVDPHEAWQVGDHALNDVAGAIRAGMSGVFYDPTGDQFHRAFDDIAETPTKIINTLSETIQLAEI